MAKRKRKIHHRRRRRVSGIGDNINFMEMGLVVAGGVASKILNNKLAASTNATMQKAAPYSGILLGIVLPMLVKRNDTIKNLSLGLVAGGGITALGATGLKVINGFENTVSGIGYPYYQQVPFKQVAGIGNTAGNQGLMKGTRSNFSGSRNSQINTIAGIQWKTSGTVSRWRRT